ncbi:succinate dehydrogenase cytochrome b560 subunit, mitochondrial-like [Rhipicephalus sanguineus]|uniref:succinate dehydrogenase cytochrome b560 subunit, mitochondrial-like n=1 Tax=Rhipicephalus sanguineus TaxID=34632 RepID=UPI001893E72D|nr:succinate dehydrogenase cytochrome b560 subunit, mitochondrial-like [Rhipicephalus sanguineus]
MAYAVRFANRASALSLLRPATAVPSACLAPMSAMSPKQEEATEYFFKKNKSLKRPLSPHLSIYAPQMTSMLSLTHRATGCAMAVGLYGMGVMPFMCSHNFPHYVEALQAMHISPILTFPVKLGLPFASPIHTFNGMRHLAWDLGLGFSLRSSTQQAFCHRPQSGDGSSVGLQVDHLVSGEQHLQPSDTALPYLRLCIDMKRKMVQHSFLTCCVWFSDC